MNKNDDQKINDHISKKIKKIKVGLQDDQIIITKDDEYVTFKLGFTSLKISYETFVKTKIKDILFDIKYIQNNNDEHNKMHDNININGQSELWLESYLNEKMKDKGHKFFVKKEVQSYSDDSGDESSKDETIYIVCEHGTRQELAMLKNGWTLSALKNSVDSAIQDTALGALKLNTGKNDVREELSIQLKLAQIQYFANENGLLDSTIYPEDICNMDEKVVHGKIMLIVGIITINFKKKGPEEQKKIIEDAKNYQAVMELIGEILMLYQKQNKTKERMLKMINDLLVEEQQQQINGIKESIKSKIQIKVDKNEYSIDDVLVLIRESGLKEPKELNLRKTSGLSKTTAEKKITIIFHDKNNTAYTIELLDKKQYSKDDLVKSINTIKPGSQSRVPSPLPKI